MASLLVSVHFIVLLSVMLLYSSTSGFILLSNETHETTTTTVSISVSNERRIPLAKNESRNSTTRKDTVLIPASNTNRTSFSDNAASQNGTKALISFSFLNKTKTRSGKGNPYYYYSVVNNDDFTNPCGGEETESSEDNSCENPEIRLNMLVSALSESEQGFLPCDPEDNQQFEILKPLENLKLESLLTGEPSSRALLHETAIRLHMFSDYLRRSQITQYSDIVDNFRSISCNFVCRNRGLRRSDMDEFVKMVKEDVQKLKTVNKVDEATFSYYHCAFLAAGRKVASILSDCYNKHEQLCY